LANRRLDSAKMTRPSQLLEGPSRCLRLSCNAVSCAQQLSSTIRTQHKARKNLNRNTNKLQCNNPPVEQYSPGLSYFPQYRSKASLFSLANRRLDSAKTSTHKRTPQDDSRPPEKAPSTARVSTKAGAGRVVLQSALLGGTLP